MRTVREWEYTSRFGHLGNVQTNRANGSRVVEYFSDSYEDAGEAVHKAELFLSICDYIGRHASQLSKKDLMERVQADVFSVDPALLRAVHHVFTTAFRPAAVDPRKVLGLAQAFREIEPWA